jgi:hypothetical protein
MFELGFPRAPREAPDPIPLLFIYPLAGICAAPFAAGLLVYIFG